MCGYKQGPQYEAPTSTKPHILDLAWDLIEYVPPFSPLLTRQSEIIICDVGRNATASADMQGLPSFSCDPHHKL